MKRVEKPFKKLNGYRPSHRDRWSMIRELDLSDREFLLYELLIDHMDFDISHKKFGCVEFIEEEYSIELGVSIRTIKNAIKRLKKIGIVQTVDKRRNLILITNPTRYISCGANKYTKQEKSLKEKIATQNLYLNNRIEEIVFHSLHKDAYYRAFFADKDLGLFKVSSRFNLFLMNMSPLEVAMYYLNKCRWSVIPVSADKAPIVQWKEYQTEFPGIDEIHEWFEGKSWNEIGIALVAGFLSKISIIDDDFKNGIDNLNLTTTIKVRTANGGYHSYFKYDPSVEGRAIRGLKNTDIIASNGYIILPPTKMANGNYEWITEVDENSFAEEINNLPIITQEQGIRLKLTSDVKTHKETYKQKVINASVGERNDSLFKYGCSIVNTLDKESFTKEMFSVSFQMKNRFANRNEVESIIKSALTYKKK